MMRFAVLTAGLLSAALAPSARGQGTDEVELLKKEIEVLKARLEVSGLKVEKLQKEIDQLKAAGAGGAKAADDGFGVGTKFSGTMTRSWVENGRPVVKGNTTELEVTKRSGKEFTAEAWSDNRQVGAEAEGTIDNGVVKFKSTKSLTDKNDQLVGLHAFSGRLDKGILKGTMTKRGDPSYKAVWDLKAKKD